MNRCRQIALSDEVRVKLRHLPHDNVGVVTDYDEEMEEYLVEFKNTWRQTSSIWAGCHEIEVLA